MALPLSIPIEPREILIVKLSALGDVIHVLPAVNAIRRRYPEARITWLVEEEAAGLLHGHPAIDRLLVSCRKSWLQSLRQGNVPVALSAIRSFIRELRATRYDLVIDFQALLKSGILVGLCRGQYKAGYGRGMDHQEFSYLFLNRRVAAVGMESHVIARHRHLLAELGIAAGDLEYRLPVTAADRLQVQKILANHGLAAEDRYVAMNPMTTWATKLWSGAKFAALADAVSDRFGLRVVFTGSRADQPAVAEIINGMAVAAVNLAGATTLIELAALFEKAECLVSTDSGPMHIAAAVGTPVVALFGPTAPWRTGPYGEGHQVVRADLSCAPCFKRRCASPDCMAAISVEQVMAALEEIMPSVLVGGD